MIDPLPLEQYPELENDYIGVCTECGAERECCEPDADNYHCEECGADAVQGAMNLLALGLFE